MEQTSPHRTDSERLRDKIKFETPERTACLSRCDIMWFRMTVSWQSILFTSTTGSRDLLGYDLWRQWDMWVTLAHSQQRTTTTTTTGSLCCRKFPDSILIRLSFKQRQFTFRAEPLSHSSGNDTVDTEHDICRWPLLWWMTEYGVTLVPEHQLK